MYERHTYLHFCFTTSLFLAVTAWLVSPDMLNPVDALLQVYTGGLGGYFGSFFFIFVLGAIFGKLTAISGAADSVASLLLVNLVKEPLFLH